MSDKAIVNQAEEDPVMVVELTRIVREVDRQFERVGGSSRHWVRDCFLPGLNQAGWMVVETSTQGTRGKAESERDRLRAALVCLVGVDGLEDLREMEAMMRLLPAPAEDRAATIDAIHALIATVK